MGRCAVPPTAASSRFSRRTRQLTEFLEARGFATLLLDLLTQQEDAVDQRTLEFRLVPHILVGDTPACLLLQHIAVIGL